MMQVCTYMTLLRLQFSEFNYDMVFVSLIYTDLVL